MKTENNNFIDKQIKDKISDHKLIGNKGNWALMKHLLKEEKRQNKRRRRIQFISSSLIVVSAILFLFNHFSADKNIENKSHESSQVPAQTLDVKEAIKEIPGVGKIQHESSSGITKKQNTNSVSAPAKRNSHPNHFDSPLADRPGSGSPKGENENNNPALPGTFSKNPESPDKNSAPGTGISKHDSYDDASLWDSDLLKIEITNIGATVNSPYSDFAPVVSADGANMFFTSRRPITEKEKRQKKEALEQIYACTFNSKKKKWESTQMVAGTINIPQRNNSAIGLSNDGQQMLIYRDDINGNGDIYESTLHGREWTEPTPLGDPINTKYHESSASLSPDGRTLYFVSDRPGGIGGRDIWYSVQDANGKWGKAINLGEPVNTKEDEEGIFIHPDGKTIYFSSKGHAGIGGYDIYKSSRQLSDKKWCIPFNLGKPLNTTGDDVYFVMEANGETGYYASSRPGGKGEKDIYKVAIHRVRGEKISSSPNLVLLTGIVYDELNNKPFEADIEIIDNEKNEHVAKVRSNSTTGKYLISLPAGKNYGIHVSSKDYLFHSENFNIPDSSSYKEVTKDIGLKNIEVGNTIILKNIFYDFDKATLRGESVSELEKLISLLSEHNSVKIELASHTDSKGSVSYNNTLSQARAQSVVDYLVGKGINKERLIAKGYGESMPITVNQNPDGSDNPEGRQMNRRTEFKILAK